jgi:hypothetical protein
MQTINLSEDDYLDDYLRKLDQKINYNMVILEEVERKIVNEQDRISKLVVDPYGDFNAYQSMMLNRYILDYKRIGQLVNELTEMYNSHYLELKASREALNGVSSDSEDQLQDLQIEPEFEFEMVSIDQVDENRIILDNEEHLDATEKCSELVIVPKNKVKKNKVKKFIHMDQAKIQQRRKMTSRKKSLIVEMERDCEDYIRKQVPNHQEVVLKYMTTVKMVSESGYAISSFNVTNLFQLSSGEDKVDYYRDLIEFYEEGIIDSVRVLWQVDNCEKRPIKMVLSYTYDRMDHMFFTMAQLNDFLSRKKRIPKKITTEGIIFDRKKIPRMQGTMWLNLVVAATVPHKLQEGIESTLNIMFKIEFRNRLLPEQISMIQKKKIRRIKEDRERDVISEFNKKSQELITEYSRDINSRARPH